MIIGNIAHLSSVNNCDHQTSILKINTSVNSKISIMSHICHGEFILSSSKYDRYIISLIFFGYYIAKEKTVN